MAFSSCFCHSPFSFKVDYGKKTIRHWSNDTSAQSFTFTLRGYNTEVLGQQVVTVESHMHKDWSFVGGSTVPIRPKLERYIPYRKCSGVYMSWLASSQIASRVFTLGTTAVLPFYALMVLAPKAQLTKVFTESSIPYVLLGVLYAYLLYLSWTPETLQLIFGSKYWLPELTGIAKMFTNEITLASAWIHLQVFSDGLQNQIETRHSVSLCLFFCPIGILTHDDDGLNVTGRFYPPIRVGRGCPRHGVGMFMEVLWQTYVKVLMVCRSAFL
ncbi:hypothetical protein C1H46_034601 [Malus baccata]|uniref:Neoxanthin synthase n=1 Tax=Malus baccata TaxID=106549 RepID=A0A540L0J9_MALBA|nr:hypothetical protein C1H46_034601 [Malus baccata]